MLLIHELTQADVDEALGYARESLATRRACGLDVDRTREWIDNLLDLRLEMV